MRREWKSEALSISQVLPSFLSCLLFARFKLKFMCLGGRGMLEQLGNLLRNITYAKYLQQAVTYDLNGAKSDHVIRSV